MLLLSDPESVVGWLILFGLLCCTDYLLKWCSYAETTLVFRCSLYFLSGVISSFFVLPSLLPLYHGICCVDYIFVCSSFLLLFDCRFCVFALFVFLCLVRINFSFAQEILNEQEICFPFGLL